MRKNYNNDTLALYPNGRKMIKQYMPDSMYQYFPPMRAPNVSGADIEFIPNATICVDRLNYTGVVYDKNGNLCRPSITYRFGTHTNIAKFSSTHNFINEHVVFAGGGYIFSHFGHFLLEGLARLYPMLDDFYRDKKFVFVVRHGTKSLPAYVMNFLSAIGITPENIILIDKTTKFAGVYVPPQASDIAKYIAPIMIRVFDLIAKNLGNADIKTYDKIYMSRGKMNDGRTFGESQIEHIFEKNGYKIIYPEKLSLDEQITLVHNCRVLSGTAGTALHLAVFMRPGGHVVQIKRNSGNADNAYIQNQICELKNLNFTTVFGSIERIPTGHFSQIPQIIGITDSMIKFFDDNNFKYTKQDIVPDNNAWSQYNRQMRRYKIAHAYSKIIKPIARILSVFGITKYGRNSVREYITHIMHAD